MYRSFPLSALLLSALTALATTTSAHAQEPPAEVRIPLAQYQALLDAARLRGGPQATWSTGSADIRLPEGEAGFVTVEARGEVTTVGEGTTEALLLPGHVIVESIQIDGAEAAVIQKGGAHVALIGGGERHGVVLRYQVAKQPSADGELAVVPLPPFAGTRVSVTGADSVDVWPSGNVLSPAPNLSVQIPATSAMVVRWGSGSDLVRRVDYKIIIDPGSDGATVEARIEVDLDGARGSVPLAPSTIALTEVQEGGKSLPTRVAGEWHRATITGPGRHVIVASMRVAIDRSEGQPQVTLPLPPAPIVRVEAKVPGNRAVELEPAVPVALTVVGEGDDAVTTAIAHLPPSEQVVLSWTEPRTAPEQVVSVNTETYQLVRIEEGVIRSKIEIRYEIIRGTLKELPIQLPDAAVLYKVTGEGIEDWRTFAATDTEPRQARIVLGAEREGSYTLELELEQVAPQTVGQAVDIPIVRPLGVAREMGVVALFDGDKVGFAEATAEGYVRSGEDALPIELRQKLGGDIVSQAFKHLGAPAKVGSAVAAAKTREIRFDAHVSSLYTFQQSTLNVANTITIDVKSGRTDRIVVSLPANVKVGTDISAPNLKEADWVEGTVDEKAARRDFEILLTRALEGTIEIELPLEVIIGGDVTKLALPDVRVQGADVKKGDIGITAEPGIELKQASIVALRKLDLADLPHAITMKGRREVQLGYSYSYVDEPWKLELEVRRHRAVETLTAAIMQAWIETTVFEEGQIVTTALFRVRTDEQQPLRVKLPTGAKLLGVSVEGQRSEANEDETGALKIDIRQKGESFVEIAYMTSREALGFLSSVDLEAARPDVFVTDLQWLVRVPEKITIYGTSSALEELPADQYRYPPSAKRVSLQLNVAANEATTNRLFVAKVLDVSDTRALAVSVSTLSAPPALGAALLVVAIVLIGFGVWRRARRQSSGLVTAALVGGFALLVLRIVIWGIDGEEAIALALVLAAVAITSWLMRRRDQLALAEASAVVATEEQA